MRILPVPKTSCYKALVPPAACIVPHSPFNENHKAGNEPFILFRVLAVRKV